MKTKRHRRWLWMLSIPSLGALWTLVPIKAQHPPAQDHDDIIRLSGRLVVVPVSVTDASGRPILNLKAEEFLLEEDGRPQPVLSLDEPGQTPMELALLVDVSGSTRARFQFEQQAAARFLKEMLKPNDAVAVFLIGPEPTLVRARTTSVEEAITGLQAIEPSRSPTAFFDSVVQAAQTLGKSAGPLRRRVLVAISDGEDNYSHRYQLHDALRELQRADCLFYSINPNGPSIRLNRLSLKGQQIMKTLAAQTGGRVFTPVVIEELAAVFGQIAAELRAQYLLGYYSTNEAAGGQFRRITVQVPDRSELRVRARQGYYPQK